MFWQVLKRKPVEFVCAVVMVAAGVYVSGASVSGSASSIVGNLLSALGGALLSWSTVSLTTKDAAAEILSPQLSAIARQLVAVSGQISKAVYDVRVGEISEGMAIEMVSQASRIMYASVNEIYVVLNQKVDADELLETAQRVEDLAARLSKSSGQNNDVVENELIEAVSELRSQVKAIVPISVKSNSRKPIPKAAPHEMLRHSVECPECSNATEVLIGPAYGSSAMPECSSCGTKFHAHRGQDGAVITKLPGKKSAAR